ncbi:deaminase [Nakamurella sp. YIM 132087]|uniref:Deaminase n=1 Tax=Nakamurella alba TaxID=2665158 RepID=A0A7K1FSR0_9ACTN|nr:dihydrofolate reductase family protein [Nakamurella alba]MTD17158.1 deaminase [Nakamurella alba]
MHSIVAVENVTLDGVMQSPGRPDEDTRGGFDRGGWANALLSADPEAAQAAMSGQNETVALMFGRRTYHDLVGHWLTTSEPNPFTDIIRETPKYVISRNPDEELPYPNSTLLAGDAATTVAEFKSSGDGEVVILGSGVLVRDLAAAGLVDTYILTVLPLVLGKGQQLFEGTPIDLDVRRSTTSGTGIVTAVYDVRR